MDIGEKFLFRLIDQLKTFFKTLFAIGCSVELGYEEARYVRLTNQISILFIMLTIPYIYIFYWMNSVTLSVLALLFVGTYLACLYLNHLRCYLFAKVLLVSSIGIATYIYTCSMGTQSGVQYLFFYLVVTASFIFGRRHDRVKWVFIVGMLLLYFGVELVPITPSIVFPDHYLHFFRYSMILNLFILLVFTTHFHLSISQHFKQTLSSMAPLHLLTAREMEIVMYLLKGQNNRQISDSLFIEEGTVKVHLNSIYKKLNVKTRTALMALFINVKTDLSPATPPPSPLTSAPL
ncbi:MAG: hypothetical protein CL521_00715 [Actinobacteria bacterium]|nr:hypothetical protein [Actinomycetota bacterium]